MVDIRLIYICGLYVTCKRLRRSKQFLEIDNLFDNNYLTHVIKSDKVATNWDKKNKTTVHEFNISCLLLVKFLTFFDIFGLVGHIFV